MFYLPRNDASDPPPERNGYRVVAWPPAMRLISAFGSALMILALAGLVASDGAPAVLWGLVIGVNALTGAGVLYFWRARNEYNETTIVTYSMFGEPRTFSLSEFVDEGAIGVLGHEFSTKTGDRIHVNSFQRGAATLIKLLQRQVSAG